jgi:serine/threonine protein kinase
MKSFLAQLLRTSKTLTDTEILALEDFIDREAIDAETPLKTLIRLGYAQPTSEKALDMVNRGYITDPNIGMFLRLEKLEDLKRAIDAYVEEPPTNPTTVAMPPVDRQAVGSAEIGKVFGKCLITGVLGKGGNGIVFSALHQTLNIPVAVKLILEEHARSEKTRAVLRREAQLLARLNHPNIVRVLDFEDCERPYVVMEMVEGPSLSELVESTGGVICVKAVQIMLDIVEGLWAAQTIGMVHRDIKPANILLSKSGEAKLADLGLAFTHGHGELALTTSAGLPLGTCAYMSPEQIRSSPDIDFRTDMYSLGATFYHAVTGRLPFQSKNPREVLMKHLTENPVPPNTLSPMVVDSHTSDIIMRLLQKNPDHRYPSYEELRMDLIELLVNLRGQRDTVDFSNRSTGRDTSSDEFLRKTQKFPRLSRQEEVPSPPHA